MKAYRGSSRVVSSAKAAEACELNRAVKRARRY